MNKSQLRARYRRIMIFFARATVNFVFWEIILRRLGFRKLSNLSRSKRLKQLASQFRSLAIGMGGVMIKVGQFLSSRLDVLPAEITDELAGLQDEVPAEDFAAIRQLAEAELGARLEDVFASFDQVPMAAASLGQVHQARLSAAETEANQFQDVVVKVQRPHIEQLMEVDLRALKVFGGWLEKYRPIRERVDIRALIGEFTSTTYEEIDYLSEGKNAEIFTENFKDHPGVHVPRVVWNHTTRRVLTLEDVFAIKITNYEAITSAGLDRGEVARRLLDTYLKQIFEDGFFHADPHPGNLFITPDPGGVEGAEKNWQLTFVDFGMVGRVPANLRDGLREMLIAVGTRDAARMVRSYQILDVLLPGANLKLIEQAEEKMFEIFWGKSMSDLKNIDYKEMHKFAFQFRELMYSMPFQLPNNLLMLGRTVAILSGMCTGLDPNFNLWEQLMPYAQKIIKDEATTNWKVWLDEAGVIVKKLLAIPAQAGKIMNQIESGEFQVQMPEVSRRISSLEKAVNRLAAGVVFAGLLIGGAIFYSLDKPLIGNILAGASLISLMWMFLIRTRHHPGL